MLQDPFLCAVHANVMTLPHSGIVLSSVAAQFNISIRCVLKFVTDKCNVLVQFPYKNWLVWEGLEPLPSGLGCTSPSLMVTMILPMLVVLVCNDF